MVTGTDRREELRATYLRFVSAGLTSHAANLIGLSIILFAFLQVVSSYFPNRVPFVISVCPLCVSPYTLLFMLLWIINAGVFFAFMRLVFYGQLSHETIAHVFTPDATSLPQLRIEVAQGLENRIIFRWFGSGGSLKKPGFYFSIAVGFCASLFFFATFIWQW